MSPDLWIGPADAQSRQFDLDACPDPAPERLAEARLWVFPEADWARLRRWRLAGHRAVALVQAAEPPEEGRAALEPLLLAPALTAEVLAEARRTGASIGRIERGGVSVDLLRRVVVRGEEVARGEEPTRLSGLEADLLAYLAARGDRDVSREELQLQVWGHRKVLATRAVDMAISRLRRKIEPELAEGGEPKWLLTRRGGYRLVMEAPVAPVAPATQVALAIPSPLGAIPGRRGTLIGREALVAEVEAALVEGRLVTLIGPPGVGKTRLAQEVATRAASGSLREGRSEQVLWCDLAAARTLEAMLTQVSAAAGAAAVGATAEQWAAQLGLGLRGLGRALLVLDNAEQLVGPEPGAGCVAAWAAWLEAAPGLRLLVTTQARLSLAAERVCEVPVLGLAEAEALFRARAAAVGRPSGATKEQAEQIQAIVEGLDRLPLAIELAAARSRLLSLEDLGRQIRQRFRLLQDRSPDRPERHRTLKAALEWAWDLLPEAQRRDLHRLAVFRAPFGLEAAEAVLSVDPREPDPDTLERLELLIDRSLLQREGSRYRLLSSVRLLLEGQGAPPPDCIKRHAAYFVARAPTWLQMFNGARCMQAQRELSDVESDLIAAWEAEIPAADAIDLAELLDALYAAQGARTQRVALLGRAVEIGAADPPVPLARALLLRAQVIATDDIPQTTSDLQRAIGMLADYPRLCALARLQQAMFTRNLGQNGEALQQIEAALPYALRAGDPALIAHIRAVRHLLCGVTDPSSDAAHIAGLEREIRTLIQHDHLIPAHNALSWLCVLTRNSGALQRSIEVREQMFDIANQTGRKRAIALSLYNLAFVNVWRYDYQGALVKFDASMEMFLTCYTPSACNIRAAFRGNILCHQGRYAEAEAALSVGVPHALSQRRYEECAQMYRFLAINAMLQGQPDRAHAFAAHGLEQATRARARLLEGECNLQIALARAALSDPDGARAALDAIATPPTSGEFPAQILLCQLRLAAPADRPPLLARLRHYATHIPFPGAPEITASLDHLLATGRLSPDGPMLCWFRQFR